MAEPAENGIYSESHQFSFTEKRWYEALPAFLRHLYGEWATFLATVISLWAIAEVIATAAGQRLPLGQLAVPVLVLAFVASIHRAWRRHTSYVPNPLSSESTATQEIFRRQRCGWNAALAREMLLDRLNESDATLERIKQGTEYVEPRNMEREEYVAWLTTRPEAMIRLCRAAMLLCTKELPSVIGRTTSEEDVVQLKSEIDALARVYGSARDLEVQCHEILAPTEFEHVHEMTHGWTDTVREGVREFCEVLDELATIDRTDLKAGRVSSPKFDIVIGAPDNIEEFNHRLNALV